MNVAKTLGQLLKKRIADGDRDAFATLFGLYFGRIFKFLRFLVRREDVAEDLTQDLFVKLWSRRNRLTHIDNLDAYLFRMAKNAALDHFRMSGNRNLSMDEVLDEALLEYAENTEQRVTDRARIEAVRNLLAEMPPQRRNIFIMSRFLGTPNKEIAQRLGISGRTVENQLSLAKRFIEKNHTET